MNDSCQFVGEQHVCSVFRRRSNRSIPYFNSVDRNFRNFFGHASLEQAVYELNKHNKFFSLLSRLHKDNPSQNYDLCYEGLANILCRLYLPVCQQSYRVGRSDCLNYFGGQIHSCQSALMMIEQRYFYTVQWPLVQVNCDSLNENATSTDSK